MPPISRAPPGAIPSGIGGEDRHENPARKEKAGEGTRTLDIQLGKPTAGRPAPLENIASAALPVDRCTTRCTETGDRLDELARLIALVAQLRCIDAERAGLLKRAVELLGSLDPRE